MYPWLKALHLIFVVTWFAGLFYLPRLFVYHAMTDDQPGRERFKLMERKLYRGIMTPSAVLAVVCGLALIAVRGADWALHASWLHVKLTLVLLLLAYHAYLGRVVGHFQCDVNRRSHVYFRFVNEVPVLFLVAIVLLAVLKPG